MNQKTELIEVFSKLSQAHHDCDQNHADHDLDRFVTSLQDGDFFKLSPDQQLSTLHWYDEAYLGRGDLLKGLVFNKVLSASFRSQMKKSICSYLVTIDIPSEVKERMRSRLSNLD